MAIENAPNGAQTSGDSRLRASRSSYGTETGRTQRHAAPDDRTMMDAFIVDPPALPKAAAARIALY
ncbi:hypothetical protein AB9C52_22625 [Burkholderia cenocepacia]|nr:MULTISPECIES: hypothetical protein [Burkholderia]ARF89113.1 uncharacterized protein BCN122_II2370 [Burkholderia cenocepacia]MBG0872146.1 hypothetical protein [Burkholderia sp. 9777_1386]MCW3672589.1 hypothetical protein [Burkholderia cenocepacia]MDC6084994.1 hypothetical protein [Burkholderia cenocepacia]